MHFLKLKPQSESYMKHVFTERGFFFAFLDKITKFSNFAPRDINFSLISVFTERGGFAFLAKIAKLGYFGPRAINFHEHRKVTFWRKNFVFSEKKYPKIMMFILLFKIPIFPIN